MSSVIFFKDRYLGLSRESAGTRSLVTLWDLSEGVILARMQLEASEPERIGAQPSLAFAVSNGTVNLLDLKDGSTRSLLKADSRVASALCAPAMGCVAAFATRHALQVWSLDRDENLLEITGSTGLAVFSPDGTHAAVQREGAIEVWDVRGKRPIARRAAPADLADMTYLGFGPNGRRVIAASGRRVELWTWRPEDLLKAGCERLAMNAASPAWSALVSAADVEKACN